MRMLRNETLRKGLSLLLVLLMCAGLLPAAWGDVSLPDQAAAGLYWTDHLNNAPDQAGDHYSVNENAELFNGDVVLSLGQTKTVALYYYDGTNAPIRIEQAGALISAEPVQVGISPTENNDGFFTIGAKTWTNGGIKINYAGDNNASGSFLVSVVLPEVGFYSGTTASTQDYLTEWKYTGSNGTIYLIAYGEGMIYDVTVEQDSPALTARAVNGASETVGNETVTGARIWEIALDASKLDANTNGLGVHYWVKMDRENDVYELESRNARIDFTYAVPGIRCADVWNDGGTNTINNNYNSALTLSKGDDRTYAFFFFDGESNYTPLAFSSLTASAGLTIEKSNDTVGGFSGDLIRVSATAFGDARLTYASGGKTYEFPVTVSLPEVGFYKANEASVENFIETWDYKTDHTLTTVYLIERDQNRSITDVALNNDNQVGLTLTQVTEGKVYSLAVTADEAAKVAETYLHVTYKMSDNNDWTGSAEIRFLGTGTAVDPTPGPGGGPEVSFSVRFETSNLDNSVRASGSIQYKWDNAAGWTTIENLAPDGDQYRASLNLTGLSGEHTLTIRAVAESGSAVDVGGSGTSNDPYAQLTGINTAEGHSCTINTSADNIWFNISFVLSSGTTVNDYGIEISDLEAADDYGLTDELYAAAQGYINGSELAYYGGGNSVNETLLKEYVAAHLWNDRFCRKNLPNENERMFGGMFKNYNSFKDAVALAADSSKNLTVKSGSSDVTLTAYDVTVTLKAGTTATGTVYVLPEKHDFLVKTIKEGGTPVTNYYLVNTDAGSGDLILMVPAFDVMTFFGNGASFEGRLDTGAGNGAHVGQRFGMANAVNIGGLGARLAVIGESSSIVRIDSNRVSPQFSFATVPYYTMSTSAGNAPTASIYYGVNKVMITPQSGTVESIAAGPGISADAVSFTSGSETVGNDAFNYNLVLNTDYDKIPLKITLNDNTEYFLTLNRVGFDVNAARVGTEGNIEQSTDAVKTALADTFRVDHGTDHFVRYKFPKDDNSNVTGMRVVTATYYAATMANVDVSLFVKVTRKDGSIEYKVIEDALAEGKVISWQNDVPYIVTGSELENLRLQGTEQGYADFMIWFGNDEEYHEISSIELFVFEKSSSGFGGAKVGSGAGYQWTPPGEDHH